VGAFLAHGFINEAAEAFGEAAGACFIQELPHGIQEFRLAGWVILVLSWRFFFNTPTGNPLGPPSTSFSCAERRPRPGGRRREEKQFTETDLHQHWTASSKDKHFGKRYDYTLWLSRSPKHSTQFNH
jgi:hypothetical protein